MAKGDKATPLALSSVIANSYNIEYVKARD
jgi:hypothetical protein